VHQLAAYYTHNAMTLQYINVLKKWFLQQRNKHIHYHSYQWGKQLTAPSSVDKQPLYQV